jgi:tRNA(Ile)-lysidine synthase
VRRSLARNAALIADDLDALQALTDRAWAGVVAVERAGRVELRLDALREQPPALRRRLVRRAVQRLTLAPTPDANAATEGASGGLEARHSALIERLIAEGRTGGALTLASGLRVGLSYATLSLTRAIPGDALDGEPSSQQEDAVWRLPIPGALEIPALGWRVRATPLTTPPGLEGDALGPIPRLPPLTFGSGMSSVARGEPRVYLDADRVGADALTVRAWRAGDRFRPLGMAHEKKLQDVLSDAKVPRALRHRLPIVCVGERIAWVAGVRIADEFKLTPATTRALALQVEPLAEPAVERFNIQMDEMEASEQ